MRVAIVHPYPAAAGQERQGSAIIVRDRAVGTLLQGLGHTVRGFRTTMGAGGVVSSGDDYLDWAYYRVDVESVEGRRSQVRSSALVAELESWSPDYLIIKGAGTAIGSQLLEAHDVPMSIIIGGNYSDRQIASCAVVLTETPSQEEFLRPRVGSRRLLRLPKLPGAFFQADPVGSDFEYDIAVVSKFERHKNHDALKPLFDQDISIALVGDGSMKAHYEEYVRTRRARVKFTGFVAAESVAQVLAKTRVLVHPSLSEGFPRAVVEGMASGTPAVCIEGVVDWPLVHGRNGLVVPESELAEQVMALIQDPQRLADLQRGAVETAREEFSFESLKRAAVELNRRMLAAVAEFRGRTSAAYLVARARFMVIDSPRAARVFLVRALKRTRLGR